MNGLVNDDDEAAVKRLSNELARQIGSRHGPVLGGSALARALGHSSAAGLRQARRRGGVPVVLFALPGRRGVFALTTEVAVWLARARLAKDSHSGQKGHAPIE
jgi:hypothetical protein